MFLPLLFLIISILVYEDETPWDGWIFSDRANISYVDDFHTKEACVESLSTQKEKRNLSSLVCAKSCKEVKSITNISQLDCLEIFDDSEL